MMMSKVCGLLLAVSSLLVPLVYGHSWVACTDYRITSEADIDYYNDNICKGYPRDWANTVAFASTTVFGTDTGFNYQAPPSGTHACRDPLGTASNSYGYTTRYPMANYAPGSTVCLAWPSKNHVADTCTNQYIPDTELTLYASGPIGNTDPTQAQFDATMVANWTQHQNGVIDHKGFQHCPKFCENMDKSLCSQCFTVPSSFQVGKIYTFQWYWVFNAGTDPYTTCWEALIVPPSTSSSTTAAPIPATTAAPVPATSAAPHSTTAAPHSTTGAPHVATTGSNTPSTTAAPSMSTTGVPVVPPTNNTSNVTVPRIPCSFDWQCPSQPNAYCNNGLCDCHYGFNNTLIAGNTNAACACPSAPIWLANVPYCLTGTQCIFDWNCGWPIKCQVPQGQTIGTGGGSSA